MSNLTEKMLLFRLRMRQGSRKRIMLINLKINPAVENRIGNENRLKRKIQHNHKI